jgi:hypothetical protein
MVRDSLAEELLNKCVAPDSSRKDPPPIFRLKAEASCAGNFRAASAGSGDETGILLHRDRDEGSLEK